MGSMARLELERVTRRKPGRCRTLVDSVTQDVVPEGQWTKGGSLLDSMHDAIAKAIARKLDAEYNPTKGPDIVSGNAVVEVEVNPEEFGEGIRQMQGRRQPRYLGVPDSLVEAAKRRLQGTQVGVMDSKGNIKKPAGKPANRSKR